MIGKLLPARGTPRILVFATFVNTFGNGAYLAAEVLFLTRSVGLTPAQVAVALSVAAGAAVVLTTPMGYLVDRAGPRRAMIGALVTLAVAYCALVLVRDLGHLLPVACVIAVGDAVVRAANGAMIAGAVPPAERVRTRAFIRATNNAGIALGTLAAAVPLLLDTRGAYLALLAGNAVTSLAAALVVSRAGAVAAVRAPAGGPRLVALRDRPFLAFAVLDGFVAALYNAMLSLALPLWLVAHTEAPAALVSVVLLVNTIGCVTLQVWAARGMHTAAAAPPAIRRAAMLLALSCVLFASTGDAPVWAVAVLSVAAAAVHVVGELMLAGASFVVVFDLARDWAHGQYQAVHQTGRQIGNMVAPPLLTALVIGWGVPGWLGLGAMFVVVGLVSARVVGWGLHTRQPEPPADTAVRSDVAA
ncbi:MFS transporter [Couchioplanes azureus]|uniref:MFS transporter n=1 Tax=Couchioplanes caeruleus TaxID=56438 RepID=UPI00198AD2F5|nr:MFS transporter [Couchioplanes caeruleus]GGQ71744.1 MFS transporter [Couchioplanes caeruleus subsp. azureus]